jgi:hypothetical protein
MPIETGDLVPIGRFARLSGLTVKALRHYDAVGLLRPAYVDDSSGYRYYALPQARAAEAMDAAGIEPGAEPREMYESAPQEVTDPREYVTQIVWPVT